ncbi:MAG: glycosyltransferase family 2 protein [Alphaproteobacteria bacterium]|nr:MAG: glycosyltransferase family 2 protein [Alphaproteobacteria bacterium]
MSSPSPSVVISIVTYHSDLEDVCAAIASVQSQKLATHLMIADNDSGAEYQEALQSIIPKDATFLELPRNGGFGYGHNQVMLRAPASDYLLILNPDVVLHKGSLATMIAFLEAHPEVGMVAPKVFYPDESLQPLNKIHPNVLDLALRLFAPAMITRLPWVKRRLERYAMIDKGYDNAYSVPFASGCCLCIRRDVMLRLGGFDEGFFLYFEDADLSRRVHELADVWFVPSAHITHRWQRGSRSSKKLLWIMLQSAWRYFMKWGVQLV